MNSVEEFFSAIDTEWPASDNKQQLHIIGCGALMLQTSYERGTNDSDVFETAELSSDTKERLLAIAGRGTPIHSKQKMYVDLVANGIPLLPRPPTWHAIENLNAQLARLEIRALDVVDVVVSKLKPFRARDLSDIAAMIELGLVQHARLIERFKSAVDEFAYTAYATDIPAFVRNLNQVERDLLDVAESEIELPGWI
jgi:hypothetical protein